MFLSSLRSRYGAAPPGAQRGVEFTLLLVLGLALWPALVFFAGLLLLGPYEGASLTRMYGSVFGGLAGGNAGDWLLVLGPALLYALWRALRAGWHSSHS